MEDIPDLGFEEKNHDHLREKKRFCSTPETEIAPTTTRRFCTTPEMVVREKPSQTRLVPKEKREMGLLVNTNHGGTK